MKKNAILKMGFVLLFVCAAAGLLLGIVYESTKDLIADKKESVNQAAYQKVLPDAGTLTSVEVAQEWEEEILEVYSSEKGYAIKVLTKGYAGDDLEMAVGIDLNGAVTGVKVISHAETPGLGAKAAEDEFLEQYKEKTTASDLSVTKTGAASDTEIDAITGATKTSNGVTAGVNMAFAYYNEYLKGEK